MKKTVTLSLETLGAGLLVLAGVAFAIWWLFLRKKVITVNASVTVPQDEISVTYTPNPA